MVNQAMTNDYGFVCPVRNCPKKHNRRFQSPLGVIEHMIKIHGYDYTVKRLKLKKAWRKGVQD